MIRLKERHLKRIVKNIFHARCIGGSGGEHPNSFND